MKIGLGLYREQLTPDNFTFAVQAGATHIVAHLTSYFGGRTRRLAAAARISAGAIAPPIRCGATMNSPSSLRTFVRRGLSSPR